MPSIDEPGLSELKEKLSEEESVYARLLAELDALADAHLPYQRDPEIPAALAELNERWQVEPEAPSDGTSGGIRGLLRRTVRRLVEPELTPLQNALSRQQAFNSFTVQFLNRYMDAAQHHAGRLQEFSSTLVRYAQRVDRLADAKDRLYAQLGNTRNDLLLDGMDKRIESMSLGLKRAQERLEAMMSSVDLARSELRSLQSALDGNSRSKTRKPSVRAASPAPPAALASQEYVAFEQRFRGDSTAIRERLAGYVKHFEGQGPIAELGCGRGEFLELLRDAGVDAKGVDDNPEMVSVCREHGLAVEEGDLLTYLNGLDEGSLGGIFAAQVVEHLPPPVLRETLTAAYRALRKGGRIVLETVNTKSVVALVESFYRDLSHQKPLHPETLDFLLRSCGFQDVSIEYHSPVSERAKLLRIDSQDPNARTLNENFRKLNAFLFGDQDYAAIAVK